MKILLAIWLAVSSSMIMQVSTVRTVDATIEFTIIEIEYVIIPHESGAENQMSYNYYYSLQMFQV